MSWISLLVTFALVHIAALIAPGPDFALMLRASVSGGRRYAFYLALGLASAIMLHTITVTFAADVLQQYLPQFMTVLPWIAAIWLGYLGVSCLKASSAPHEQEITVQPVLTVKNGWWTGFATNALNPKAYVYFFSVIAGMLPHESPMAFKLALVSVFFVLSLIWFGFLGWTLNIKRFRQRLISNQPLILKFSGIILLVFTLLLMIQGYERLIS